MGPELLVMFSDCLSTPVLQVIGFCFVLHCKTFLSCGVVILQFKSQYKTRNKNNFLNCNVFTREGVTQSKFSIGYMVSTVSGSDEIKNSKL